MWQFSWMSNLIPDFILEYLVHATFLGGVVLTVLGAFADKFPFVGSYAKLARILGGIRLVVGIFFEGALSNELRWKAQVAELESKIKLAEEKSQETNEKIRVVVKEKIKVIKDVQLVIQDRIVEKEKIIDADCRVAPEAISILNDAAKNVKGKP